MQARECLKPHSLRPQPKPPSLLASTLNHPAQWGCLLTKSKVPLSWMRLLSFIKPNLFTPTSTLVIKLGSSKKFGDSVVFGRLFSIRITFRSQPWLILIPPIYKKIPQKALKLSPGLLSTLQKGIPLMLTMMRRRTDSAYGMEILNLHHPWTVLMYQHLNEGPSSMALERQYSPRQHRKGLEYTHAASTRKPQNCQLSLLYNSPDHASAELCKTNGNNIRAVRRKPHLPLDGIDQVR